MPPGKPGVSRYHDSIITPRPMAGVKITRCECLNVVAHASGAPPTRRFGRGRTNCDSASFSDLHFCALFAPSGTAMLPTAVALLQDRQYRRPAEPPPSIGFNFHEEEGT